MSNSATSGQGGQIDSYLEHNKNTAQCWKSSNNSHNRLFSTPYLTSWYRPPRTQPPGLVISPAHFNKTKPNKAPKSSVWRRSSNNWIKHRNPLASPVTVLTHTQPMHRSYCGLQTCGERTVKPKLKHCTRLASTTLKQVFIGNPWPNFLWTSFYLNYTTHLSQTTK